MALSVILHSWISEKCTWFHHHTVNAWFLKGVSLCLMSRKPSGHKLQPNYRRAPNGAELKLPGLNADALTMGQVKVKTVAMYEYPINWLIAAASICGSRAWYDYHHWWRLVKILYLAQSCVDLFSKKAMCVCFDDLVHIFLCSHAVLFCESATNKFVNFACGNCCHFFT